VKQKIIGILYFELVAKGLSQPSDYQNIIETPKTTEVSKTIPDWIRNNAKWWAKGQIADSDFVNGIQHLIKEKIINVPDVSSKQMPKFVDPDIDPNYYINRYNNEPEYKSWFDTNYPDYTIYEAVGITDPMIQLPDWIRNNAGWWAEGMIAEDDFVNAIQFLIKEGIIKV